MTAVDEAARVLAADANLTDEQIHAVLGELDRYFLWVSRNNEPLSLSRFRLRVVLRRVMSLRKP